MIGSQSFLPASAYLGLHDFVFGKAVRIAKKVGEQRPGWQD